MFLARLGRSPVFLASHLRSLCPAAYGALKNRVRTRLYGDQHGGTGWPRWMTERVSGPSPAGASSPAPRLPQYPPAAGFSGIALVGDPCQVHVVGDPEQAFARNRWGFLLDAVLVEDSASGHVLEAVYGWIAHHTDRQSHAWETYSACERVANLLVYMSASNAAPGTVSLAPALRTFIAASAEWIATHVEFHGAQRTNNHILNNARALVLAGAAIGDRSAVEAGMQIFRACLPTMVSPEGFLRERSSHYQLVVLNWVLDATHFCASFGGEESDDTRFLRAVAARMVEASGFLCDDRGRLHALVGDISPDISPAKSSARLTRLYPLLWPASSSHSSSVVRDDWFALSVGADHVVGNFPTGSFPPSFPTHGHADHTSVVWCSGGNEILADPGRSSYVDEPVARFQQSALGHNLPLINGFAPVSESLIPVGHWWARPYSTARLELTVTADGICLGHDGFARATPVEWHARSVEVRVAGVTIVDSFRGEGMVEVSLCWNFGPGFSGFDTAALRAHGPVGLVQLAVDGVQCRPTVAALSGVAPGSWRSEVYGEACAAVGVSLSWHVRLPVTIATRLDYVKCAE